MVQEDNINKDIFWKMLKGECKPISSVYGFSIINETGEELHVNVFYQDTVIYTAYIDPNSNFSLPRNLQGFYPELISVEAVEVRLREHMPITARLSYRLSGELEMKRKKYYGKENLNIDR